MCARVLDTWASNSLKSNWTEPNKTIINKIISVSVPFVYIPFFLSLSMMLIFDGSHFVFFLFFRFLLSKMMRMMMIRSCSYLQSPLQFHVFDFSCLKSFLCIVLWHHASYTNQWQLHSECQKISRVKADEEEKVRQRESGIEFNLIRSLDVRSIVFFMAFSFFLNYWLDGMLLAKIVASPAIAVLLLCNIFFSFIQTLSNTNDL